MLSSKEKDEKGGGVPGRREIRVTEGSSLPFKSMAQECVRRGVVREGAVLFQVMKDLVSHDIKAAN